jgi:hypothetical protein
MARARIGWGSFSLSLSLSCDLAAQAVGFHPHVAPVSDPGPVNVARPPSTPLLNVPDQVWNNGEGFPAAMGQAPFALVPDQGGFLSADYVEGLRAVDIHSFWPQGASAPSNWHTYQFVNHQQVTVTVSRFVGYLRPSQLGGYATQNGAPILDAAFEIFAPTSYDPAKPTVVVIGCWATHPTPLDPAASGPQNQRADRFQYPGFRRADGLVLAGTAGIARPGPDIVNLVANPPSGHQVISAYIVPRTFPRPMVFEMQRYRRLAKAIDLMLGQPGGSALLPPTFPTLADPLPKLLAGGSFGGLTAQAGVLQFPNEFHGAAANAFSGSVRRTMGEQFTWDLIGRRCGTGLYETSLNLQDTLEWGAYYRLEGWDYFNSSTMLRLRRGEVYRPMMFLVADEDTVTCGVDWLPSLSGVRGYDARGLALGVAPQGFVSPSIYWSVVDKRCHGEGGELVTPVGGVPTTWIADADREFVTVVAAEAAQNAGQVAVTPPFVHDDGSEDPYDALLARGLRPPGPASPLLQLDPNFGAGGRTVGHGLTLGWDESLKSVRDGDTTHVYAGDADGVVHRFVFDAATSGFVEQARSRSLGFGAWALEVGELEGEGQLLVVGTLRHLHLLDAFTLVPVGNPSVLELDFEWERPRRIALADVHAAHPGNEILVSTFQGYLLVFDRNLELLTDLGEPGIQDFVVHEGQPYAAGHGTGSDVPISLLSHRGHVVNVTLNDQSTHPSPPPAMLHAWTPGERGGPHDLEVVDDAGTRRLFASYATDTGFDTPIKEFDPQTLAPVGSGIGLNAQYGGPIAEIEPLHDSSGALLGFVRLTGNYVSFVPIGAGASVSKLLGTFSPAHEAIALHAVDLVGGTPAAGEPVEEIVVSTRSGHLVWFRLFDILDPARASLILPRPPVTPWAGGFAHTNKTTAGTWGLVSREIIQEDEELIFYRLYGTTQAGELFEVDPQTGATNWLTDFKHLTELWNAQNPSLPQFVAALPLTPIRDLVYVGDNLSGVSATAPELFRRSAQNSPGWWLNTKPWLNRYMAFRTPECYKDPPVDQVKGIYLAEPSPKLPIGGGGFAPLTGGGAIGGLDEGAPQDGIRELYWWGGAPGLIPNLVQGAYMDPQEVYGNWYTTEDTQSAPNYGRTSSFCKDLRNNVADELGSTYSLQSLRLARDGYGPLVVGSTAGGGFVLIRPDGPSLTQHGQIVWSSEDNLAPLGAGPHDDGYGAMALAVRQVPGSSPPAVDIFYGTAIGYPGPGRLPPSDPDSHPTSTLRWVRWDGVTMQQVGGVVHLDPSSATSGRGGFALSGLAVGDLLPGPDYSGSELVATTLEGDLFVFRISGGAIDPALGAYNSILIEDIDFSPGTEIYVGSSQGIYKWVHP